MEDVKRQIRALKSRKGVENSSCACCLISLRKFPYKEKSSVSSKNILKQKYHRYRIGKICPRNQERRVKENAPKSVVSICIDHGRPQVKVPHISIKSVCKGIPEIEQKGKHLIITVIAKMIKTTIQDRLIGNWYECRNKTKKREKKPVFSLKSSHLAPFPKRTTPTV